MDLYGLHAQNLGQHPPLGRVRLSLPRQRSIHAPPARRQRLGREVLTRMARAGGADLHLSSIPLGTLRRAGARGRRHHLAVHQRVRARGALPGGRRPARAGADAAPVGVHAGRRADDEQHVHRRLLGRRHAALRAVPERRAHQPRARLGDGADVAAELLRRRPAPGVRQREDVARRACTGGSDGCGSGVRDDAGRVLEQGCWGGRGGAGVDVWRSGGDEREGGVEGGGGGRVDQ